jgi:hypothetical protein
VESINTDRKMHFSDTVVCVEWEVQPLHPKQQKAFKLIFLYENEDLGIQFMVLSLLTRLIIISLLSRAAVPVAEWLYQTTAMLKL